MTGNPELNETILAMLSPYREHSKAALTDGLSQDDWHYVLERGREHRFLPLLYWMLKKAGALDGLPTGAHSEITAAFREQTLRSLSLQRELLIIHRLFAQAGLRHIFLKGAFLAQFAYPHPALRPARDLDVLVAPEDLEAASELLFCNGYSAAKSTSGTLEATRDEGKHIRPLRARGRSVWVEMHVRVEKARQALSTIDPFDRCMSRALSGETVFFLGESQFLMHLCVHAAARHHFDNGPLVVSDVGYFLQATQIEWKAFWELATSLDVHRSVSLVLVLTERYWGPCGIDYPENLDLVPEPILTTARQLLFRSWSERQNVNLRAALQSKSGAVSVGRLVLQRIMPEKKKLRSEFGVSTTRRQYVRQHLSYWRRLLFRRLPSFARSFRLSTNKGDVTELRRLQEWQDGTGHDL